MAGVALVGGAKAQTTIPSSAGPVLLRNFATGNPFTIDIGTVIGPVQGAATVSGDASAHWTLVNKGSVSGDGGPAVVLLQSPSALTNAGVISSVGSPAVLLSAGGTLVNLGGGTITGGAPFAVGILGTATVSNAGVIASNAGDGLLFAFAPGSVTNAGTIIGAIGSGVVFGRGGDIVNQAGATISGNGDGVSASGATATVTNAGTIRAALGAGVFLTSGGTVANQPGGIIGGGAFGVEIAGGGTIASAGTITGPSAGAFFDDVGTVVNRAGGVLSSAGGSGAEFVGPGTVTNAGTIAGEGRYGVLLRSGGIVTNQAGGLIFGHDAGVNAQNAAAAVANFGTIAAGPGPGVFLIGGGSVSNGAGAVISGGNFGVESLGDATVINAGTIGGGIAAVRFFGAGSNMLVLQAGSRLNGDAVGSAAIGAANALVLRDTGVADNNFLNFQTLDVTANAAWTLRGANTIGATTIESGARLQLGDGSHPGASVTGVSLTMMSGSTLAIGVTPTANALLTLSGSAALAGTLELVPGPGLYRRGASFAVIAAGGGVTGSFGAVTSASAIQFALSDPPALISATVTDGRFISPDASANQSAIGDAIANVPLGNANFDAAIGALNSLSPSQQNAVLDMWGCEIYADFRNVTRRELRGFLRSMTDARPSGRGASGLVAALSDAPIPSAGRPLAWAQAYGHFGSFGGDGNAHGFSSSTGGGVLGVEEILDSRIAAGIAIDYGHTNLSLKGLAQKGDLDHVALGAYAERRFGWFFVNGAAALGYGHGDGTRDIIGPDANRVATGSSDGFFGGVVTSAGARLFLEPGLCVEPSVALLYSRTDAGGFNESGADVADLAVKGSSENKVQSILGAKLRQRIDLSSGTLKPELRVGWAHELTDPRASITERFAAIPGSDFTLVGTGTGRDLAILGAGLTYDATERFSLYVRYDATFGRQVADHAINAGARFIW